MNTKSKVKLLLLLILATMLRLPAAAQEAICWKQNYGRGAGTIGGSCGYGEEKDAGLCYPSCGAGYTGVGPVCWQQCPGGFSDMGVSCTKPGALSSAGYPWKVGDVPFNYSRAKERCERDNPQVGCYKSGLIYYPNCPSGYHKVGDLVCSPECPNGMRDDGAFCAKGTKGRGVGTIPSCGAGRVSDAGLCYPACGAGFDGVGPACWGQCPADYPVQCGAACAQSQAACGVAIGDMVLNTTSVALNLLSFGAGSAGSSALQNASKAASTAAGKAILNSTAKSTSGLVFNSAKSYAFAYGKEFLKTTIKNKVVDANKYWTAAKLLNTGALKSMNTAATEFGVLKDSGTMDLSMLTVLDPTGISSMVMSFTKYGSCSGDDFLTNYQELDFGNINGTATRSIVLTAQRKMTVTRVATPALSGCSLTADADCIGRELSPGQSCTIDVGASGTGALDAELRIYTNAYSAIPYPIHIVGNRGAAATCSAVPGVEESANVTAVAGAWAYNGNQSQKMTVTRGQTSMSSLAGTVTPAGDVGRAFRLSMVGNYAFTLDETGENLTGPILDGPVTLPALGKTLDVSGASMVGGTPLTQWSNNGGRNQRFYFEPQTDGTYKIIAVHSGLVLDVWGLTKDPGAPVYQNGWNSGANQRFRVEPAGDGSYFRIISVYSGLVLQANGDGNTITQQVWNDSPGQRWGLNTAGTFVRRPWSAGCNAGEVAVAGLCYDVPVGYAVTAPGFMGKVCPYDWRDDGTVCWPPWTGRPVDNVADPNGSETMRHPLVVTSCTSYSQVNGQSCPANWYRSAVCSCQPSTRSKGVKSIIGHIPN